ncbi:hypothetical protein TUM4438_46720 [Shewanella sairae]|uniref:Uncharacterized protein n=1 Tax=Shewanella sairae TaxID=190310 RepID=A0ABQ4NTE9_9GAMM|nr:hypothetical protein [Shewanella sairae]MCL1132758.1 hypothetical protein [Shewanella sairae]GIU02458.1 hypothetical protein TUM4438_46720 [Shewanella sairae]
MSEKIMGNNQSNFVKLLSGGYRLVDIFWAGYFIVGTILGLIVSKLQSVESVMIGICLNSIYLIIISVGVWNSATKFIGKKHWAILAKIFAILIVMSSLMQLIALGYILLKD